MMDRIWEVEQHEFYPIYLLFVRIVFDKILHKILFLELEMFTYKKA